MVTLEAWVKAQEQVDIAKLAPEDRRCNICYKEYNDKVIITPETKDRDIKEFEGCVLPVKLPCGHIMGGVCLLEWLTPSPNGGNGNSCPMCRDVFFAPWPQQPVIQNQVADNATHPHPQATHQHPQATHQHTQQNQEETSSDTASDEEDSDHDPRSAIYDVLDQEDYSDPFWMRIDGAR